MPSQATHPSPEELNAYSLGQLPPAEAAVVEGHISECEPCCETMLGLASGDTFVALLQAAKELPVDRTADLNSTSADGPSRTLSIPSPLADHPRYEIVELIGKGGMGDVYKARHRMMDRTVAIKIINRELVQRADAIDRFHREVQTAARLSHPNIVTAHDAEEAGGVHFLVMEFVDGVDLARTVRDRGALPIGEACDYVRQAACGLQSAHERGMVHRDIKPHNLMVTADGTVKILDFGLAGLAPQAFVEPDMVQATSDLTAAGSIMGTPDFISPEQAADAHQADIRSDIYSLGATFYFLLSGQAPFAEGSVMHKLKNHAESEPRPIESLQVDVPTELAEVIRRMMAKDPAARFQTPAELADALAPLVDRYRTSDAAVPPQPSTQRQPPASRNWLMWMLGAFAVLLAGIIYVVTDTGTLVIESNDENVEIAVRPLVHDSHEGSKHSTTMQYRIGDTTTGSTVKRLRSGAYIVDLKGRENEYEVSQDRFVLKRGGKVVVTVTRRDDSDALPADVTPARPSPEPAQTGLVETARYDGLDAYMLHLDVSPNGRWLVSASGQPECKGIVWDVSTGKEVSHYDRHFSTIYRVAFSPDSRLVALAHWDGVVSLFDPETGKHEGKIDGHDGRLEYLTFSPDGKYLATGTTSFADAHSLGNNADVSFRIFDVATRKLVHQHNFVTTVDKFGGIWELQFSPDSTRLLVAVELGPDVKIDSYNMGFVDEFEVGTWKQLRRLCVAPTDGSKVRTVRYSPDGRWIATGHQATYIPNERWWDDPRNSVIRIWDAKSFKLVQTLQGHRSGIRSLDFSPDSKLLVSANGYQWANQVAIEGIEYTIRLWDVASGKEITSRKIEETVQCVRFTTDGTSVVSGSGGLGQEPLIQRWSVPTTEPSNPGRAAGSLPDETTPLSAQGTRSSPGKQRQVVDPLRVLPHDGSVASVTYLPDGTIVSATTGDPDHSAKVWFWGTESESDWQWVGAPQTGISHLVASADGKWLATGSRGDHRVVLWDAQTRKHIQKFDAGGMVHSVAISPDSKLLAAASWDGSARVWSVNSHDLVKNLDGYGRVHRVAFSPDGGMLAVSETPSGRTDLFETRTWMEQASCVHGYGVGQMAFSPDGRVLVTGGAGLRGSEPYKMSIKVWDFQPGRMPTQFNEMQNAVEAVAISPDSRYLIAVGGNWGDDPDWGGEPHAAEPIRIWDLTNESLVSEFDGHDTWVRGVAFSPDGKQFATAAQEVKVWDLDACIDPHGNSQSEPSGVRQ